MREKPKKEEEKKDLGVADGLDFSSEIEDEVETAEPKVSEQTLQTKTSKRVVNKAEIDPNRNYSPYYTPKPKTGSRGGTLGRGAVEAEKRKEQFSLTCTPAQKEAFKQAAAKEKRKLPEFICIAVEEYIERHGL